jgi:hypothetical protein
MDNPYAAPTSNLSGANSHGSTSCGEVTAGVVRQLARTKGWVRFLSIMGWIGGVLFMLCGAVLAVTLPGLENELGGIYYGSFSSGLTIGVGIVYLIMGILMIYPAFKLFRYASTIASFTPDNLRTLRKPSSSNAGCGSSSA